MKQYFKNLFKDLFPTAEPKRNLYSVAARYTIDGEPKLSTAAVVAVSEDRASAHMRAIVINNNTLKRIQFHTIVANKASRSLLDKIKREC